jgi:hypothetical protein
MFIPGQIRRNEIPYVAQPSLFPHLLYKQAVAFVFDVLLQPEKARMDNMPTKIYVAIIR